MKDNCEGDESTPSLPISEPKINTEEGEVVTNDKGYFGSYPKEEKVSDLKSLSEFPKEVEDKPPPIGCELGNLKEKNMMQRDGHSSEFWNILQHDEAEILRHEMLSDFCIDHMSFQPSEIPSTSNHGSDFVENSKASLYVENEFCVVDPWNKKNGIICYLLKEP